MRKAIPMALFSALLSQPAWAGTCETDYEVDNLFEDLGNTEAALRGFDHVGASESASQMVDGLDCLNDLLPAIMVGRVYRAIGGGLYVGGDPDAALMWLRTAAEVDPGFAYTPETMPDTHPVTKALKLAKMEIEDTEAVVVDQEFGDGSHFVDGLGIEQPMATIERYHVYQRILDSTETFVMVGNTFPDAAFEVAVVEMVEEVIEEPPEEVISTATVIKQKKWPAERVLLVGGGVAGLAASGVFYGLSAQSRNNFDASSNVADMDQYMASTNTFIIGSGISGAAGVGMLGFGVLFFVVDGDPRPTLDIRF